MRTDSVERQGTMKRRLIMFLTLALLALAVVGVACSGDSSDDAASTPEGTDEASATVSSSPEEFNAGDPSSIVGANPDLNFAALTWQGYWLSRNHFGPFVMQSGMGITFEPPMEMLQSAMAMVAQNPGDMPFLPKNMAPLQAVYASGDPSAIHDLTQIPADDFSLFRFDPDTFDTTVEVSAMAQTMLKESQWARSFSTPHFGELDGDFGAQQRHYPER